MNGENEFLTVAALVIGAAYALHRTLKHIASQKNAERTAAAKKESK